MQINLGNSVLNTVDVSADGFGNVIVTGTGADTFTLTLDEIEDLTINAGDAGANVTVGDLTGTDITSDTIVFNGAAVDDVFDGSIHSERIEAFGNGGDDRLTGGSADDLLDGGAGDDRLVGGDGDDTLQAGSGRDRLFGGAGNDTLIGGPAPQVPVSDVDFADYNDATGGITATLSSTATVSGDASVGTDTLIELSIVHGSAFDDVFVADSLFSTAARGNFVQFRGRDGDDTMTGNGYTEVNYRDADGGVIVDFDTAGPEQGTAMGLAGPDGATNIGTDTFVSGVNRMIGSNFDDQLFGSNNASGIEILRGVGGNDVIDGRGGRDRVDYQDSDIGVQVDLSGGAIGEGTANDGFGTVDTLIGIEDIRGSRNDDIITGDAGVNRLRGEGGNDILIGGDGNDILTGDGNGREVENDNGNDNLQGGAGNDTLIGEGGDDTITGGTGNDTIDGGDGDDTIIWNSGDGNDVINGGAGINDEVQINLGNGVLNTVDVSADGSGNVIVTGTGADAFTLTLDEIEDLTITGGDSGVNITIGDLTGTDITSDTIVITGTPADDFIDASAATERVEADGLGGNDTILTGTGNDLLVGGDGNDTLNGGAGDDEIFGGTGVDLLIGGAGNDTLTGDTQGIRTVDNDIADYRTATNSINVNMSAVAMVTGDASVGTDTLSEVPQVFGSAFIDTYVADGTFSTTARGDFNEFRGGDGDDVITGNGNTRVNYSDANGSVTVDLLAGTDGNAVGGTTNVGNDIYLGGVNSVRGSGFDDIILGSNAGGETFRGLGGNDTIDGRGGSSDRVDHQIDNGAVFVDLAGGAIGEGFAMDGFGGTDTLIGIERVRGSNFDDTIIGDDGVNRLEGNVGNDIIIGGDGDDRLIGNRTGGPTLPDGDYILVGGAGANEIEGNDGNDFLIGGNDATTGQGPTAPFEILDGGTGNDVLIGQGGNNELFGGDGVDILAGGSDVNRYIGGAGDDFFGAYIHYLTISRRAVVVGSATRLAATSPG